MIKIPVRKCNEVNCKTLINFRERYCDEHKEKVNDYKKDYEKKRYERDKEFIKFYNSKSWREVRQIAMLENDYLCNECLLEGKYTKADVADHIIEIKDDWSKRLDSSNIRILCHYHHNLKTIEEKKKRNGREYF